MTLFVLCMRSRSALVGVQSVQLTLVGRMPALRSHAEPRYAATRCQARSLSVAGLGSAAPTSPLNLTPRRSFCATPSSRISAPALPGLKLQLSIRSLPRTALPSVSQQKRSLYSIHPNSLLTGAIGGRGRGQQRTTDAPKLTPEAAELGFKMISSVALLLIGAAIWVRVILLVALHLSLTFRAYSYRPLMRRRSPRSWRSQCLLRRWLQRRRVAPSLSPTPAPRATTRPRSSRSISGRNST